MSVYKLTYFQSRAKAELARLLFAYQGQEYENVTFRQEDWMLNYKPYRVIGKAFSIIQSIRPDKSIIDDLSERVLWIIENVVAPFGQVPTLEIDGKVYTESVAINNYLAAEFGLYGKTAVDRLEIDQVIGKTQDLWIYIIDWIHAILGQTHKEDEFEKTNLEIHFPRYLEIFEKLLTANGSGFYVGKEMTYADIAVFDVLDIEFPDLLLEKYPKVKANRDMVRDHPRLRDYIANREPSRW